MTASKSSSSLCPADLRKQTAKHALALTHLALISTMTVYMVQIKKIFTEQQDKIRVSSANAVLNGVAVNTQNVCFSSSNMDVYNKFLLYKNIIFYSICASAVYNLFYLAFQYKLPLGRWMPTMVYGPLVAVGIVGMALSVDGFLKIRSLSNQPESCHSLLKQFKTFFIISMTTAVVQSVISMWVLKGFYIKVTL